jgi:hypothetical protein
MLYPRENDEPFVALLSQLLSHVSRCCSVDVNITELEQQMQFSWAPLSSSNGETRDHLLSLRLQNIVCSSFNTWLQDILEVVSSLPGLHFSQKSEKVGLECNRTIRCIVKEITSEFPRVKHTSWELYNRVAKACLPLLNRANAHALSVELELRSGIEAIQELCIAFLVNGSEAARPLASKLCVDTIHRQSNFCQMMGSAMDILYDIAATQALPNARGGACMPPAGAVREESILGWVSIWGPFAIDCATQELRKPMPTDAGFLKSLQETDVWVEQATLQSSYPLGLVQPFPYPNHSTHRCANGDLYIRSKSALFGSGMRVARLVSVVLQALALAVVDTQSVKGSLLMGLLLRSQSEYVLLQSGEPQKPIPQPPQTAPVPIAHADILQTVQTFGDLRGLPYKMQMELTVALSALEMAAGKGRTGNFVSLKEVAHLAKLLPMYKKQSINALLQKVAHVLRRFVDNVQLFCPSRKIYTQDLVYHASDIHGKRQRGICATKDGKLHALAYLKSLIECVDEKGDVSARLMWWSRNSNSVTTNTAAPIPN